MKKLPTILAIIFCFAFAVAGILINLNRFWQYESGYYDFGIFDRAIWLVSKFRIPIIDHLIVGGKPVFADHLYPTLFLISPLYWFTDKSEILFIVQDILVALSGYILYKIGVLVLKNAYLSLAVLISYFLFAGLQNAIYSDFHELTVMTLPLMLTYWAILKNKKALFFLFFFLTLGCKESLFLLGIGISFFIYLAKKAWRTTAIFTFLISLIWGLLAIKVIIPYFSGRPYYYSQMSTNNLTDLLLSLFNPAVKLKTVFLSLLSFLFLPVFSPSTWPILILNWTHRFVLNNTSLWGLGYHYNAEIAPTLAVSTLLGLGYLRKKIPKFFLNTTAAILILASFTLYRFVLHGPFGLAYHPVFYKHTANFKFLDKMISLIPRNSTVIAQNNLASRLLHHKEIWFLRENYRQFKADYIVMDLREGQNINNFLGAKDINNIFRDIKSNSQYKIYFHQGDQYIFKKI